jgi:hypothetical protein
MKKIKVPASQILTHISEVLFQFQTGIYNGMRKKRRNNVPQFKCFRTICLSETMSNISYNSNS